MSSLATLPLAPPAPTAAPLVDVVVPVYNEAAGVERSIRRLHRFLTDELPFSWRIVVAYMEVAARIRSPSGSCLRLTTDADVLGSAVTVRRRRDVAA
jgi:hypothetical protein